MSKDGFEEWGGYMGAKITKLEEQFAEASNPFRKSNLFQGISIFVNGLTNPSADELKRIMMVHGGIFHHYERSHTTYIIASNLPDVKIRNMNTSKIIGPEWIVDCLKEKRILDYTKYLLYTYQNRTQPKISFTKVEKQDEHERKEEILKIREELALLQAQMREPVDQQKSKDDQEKSKDDQEKSKDDQEEESKDEQEESKDVSNSSSDIFEGAEHSLRPIINTTNQHPANTSATIQNVASTSTSSMQAMTAVNPNFLSEFYNNSRLHLIATLGTGFKQYILELRENHNGVFPDREEVKSKLKPAENFVPQLSTIMHIDMDCFFVSVGLRNKPHLQGKPIAVTHSKGGAPARTNTGTDREVEMNMMVQKLGNSANEDKIRGGFRAQNSLSEIASCSYEARKKGVKNGMFVGHALNLCPDLITIPYDFEGYKSVAFDLYNIIAKYTLDIEALSCDEMFVDLTDLLNDLKVLPSNFITFLREEVRTKTGCPCSAGIGNNKLLAHMATKQAKPNGQFFLTSENMEKYMANIPITNLPGVGFSTAHTLDKLNWITCGDLQKISLAKIQMELGNKFGKTIHSFCRGIDRRPMIYGQVRKSVSTEVNYGIRFKEYIELEKFLRQLSTEVHTRLTDIKRKGKCITLKVMVRAKDAPVETSKFMGHGVCNNITKSITLSEETDNLEVITKTVLSTMKTLNLPPNELRGLGIQISKLDYPNVEREKNDNDIKSMFSRIAEKLKDKKPTDNDSTKSADPNSSTLAKTENSTGSKRQRDALLPKTAQITDMWKIAEAKNKDAEDIRNTYYLDPKVLSELPDYIRDEVLRDYSLASKLLKKKQKIETLTSPSPNTLNPTNPIPKTLPQHSRMWYEYQTRLQQVTQPKPRPVIDPPIIAADNVFINANCNRFLLSWTKSTKIPEQYDIDIVIKDATNLVRAKRIHELYDPLLFLCRIINGIDNCNWHTVFTDVIRAVQRDMILVYGYRLLFNSKIECEICNRNCF